MNDEHGAPQRFMTVEEAAEGFRVSLATVYRWCRSGRLPAKRVGRDWRISRTAFDETSPAGNHDGQSNNLLEPAFSHLTGGREHLLGLAVNSLQEQRLQTLLIDLASRRPATELCLGLWGETPEEARLRLRATLSPLNGSGMNIQILPLYDIYESTGLAGTMKALHSVAARASRGRRRLCFVNSPHRFFGVDLERLLEYERELHDLLMDSQAIGMCTVDQSTSGFLNRVIVDISEQHSGVIWFEGTRAPHLLRIAR